MVEDEIKRYVIRILSRPLCDFTVFHKGITQAGGIMGLVLDREGVFQTELFMVPFGLNIVEFHTHPNVDSIEMHVAGDFTFKSNGVEYSGILPTDIEIPLSHKPFVWVPSDHVHGGLFTPDIAGSFLSFQKWKNGVKPSSVAIDFLLTKEDKDNVLKLDRNFERKVTTYTKEN